MFTDLVCEYVQRWVEPVDKFRASIMAAVVETATSFIDASTAHAPRLAAHLKNLAVQELNQANNEATSRLDKLLQIERSPSTENHYLFDTLNKIRNDRITSQINSMPPSDGHPGFVKKDDVIAMLKSSIGNDSNESQEVDDVIDMLSAYWKVAAKRIIDGVGMTITDAFFSTERMERLEQRLSSDVMATEDSDLLQLFKQDAAREQRRAVLTSIVERMRRAKARIDSDVCMRSWSYAFGGGGGGGSGKGGARGGGEGKAVEAEEEEEEEGEEEEEEEEEEQEETPKRRKLGNEAGVESTSSSNGFSTYGAQPSGGFPFGAKVPGSVRRKAPAKATGAFTFGSSGGKSRR